MELRLADIVGFSCSWDSQLVVNGAAFLGVEALDPVLPCNPEVAAGVLLSVSLYFLGAVLFLS